jgi:N-acetylneuraminate synthase
MRKKIRIGKRSVGEEYPTYIIAEIGSNFDGSKTRAKKLINLAKKCGADAVKFQCFSASKIVSQEGFKNLKMSFQADWKKPVYQVYQEAEFPRKWHRELFYYAKKQGVDFFSAPYDREAVDILDKLNVPVFKIGSGDITWLKQLKYIARKDKPILLATGDSTIAEVDEAIRTIRSTGNYKIILLQCVTNYPSHFESANIRAMQAMGKMFDVLVGYSDHTPGSIVPLGAVALGACVIEKHFTDDKTRKGPDHLHAMDGKDFKQMVDSIRTLEKALGSPVKDLYPEEKETIILQRRCLRATQDIIKGTKITSSMINTLRPAPKNSIYPKYKQIVIGQIAQKNIKVGEHFTWEKV